MFSWKAIHHDLRYKEKSVFVLVPLIIVVSHLNLWCVKEVGTYSQIMNFLENPSTGSPNIEEEVLWSSCKVPILTALSQQILYGM